MDDQNNQFDAPSDPSSHPEQGPTTNFLSANENLDESSVEEGNEDLKSKIPELTSKKFI
jgi:hypothetical protein